MDLEQLDNWVSLSKAIVACGLIWCSASGLGYWLTAGRFSLHVNVILGLNCLGLLGLLTGWLPTAARLAMLVGLSLFTLAAWSKHLLSQRTYRFSNDCPTGFWLYKLLVAAALVLTLGPALTYPSGWDELTYHVELPRRWSLAQGLSIQSDLPYSALPSLCECLFIWNFPIESLITPRLLTWLAWMHGLFVLGGVAERLTSKPNAQVILWSLAASPISLMIAANCYVEAFMWANVACIAQLALNLDAPAATSSIAIGAKDLRRAMLLGMFVGATLAIKITAGGLLGLPLLLAGFRGAPAHINRRQLALTLLAAMSFASPFYLRLWLLVGNPLSPYFAQWFTTDLATIQCSRYHHDLASGNFGMAGWSGGVAGPLCIAFANELYDGNFGWQWFLLLMIAGLGAFGPVGLSGARRRLMQTIWLQCVALYLVWCATAQQARFAVPLFVLIMLASCHGLTCVRKTWQPGLRMAIALLTIVSIPWTNTGYYLDSWLCVLKVLQPVEYLRDGVGDSYVELAHYLSHQVAAEEKVVTLFEHRLAYLPSQVEIATPFFQTKYFTRPLSQTSENLMAELHQHGIKYVVLTTNLVGPDQSLSRIDTQQRWFKTIDQCIADGKLQIIWKSDQHAVAEVN